MGDSFHLHRLPLSRYPLFLTALLMGMIGSGVSAQDPVPEAEAILTQLTEAESKRQQGDYAVALSLARESLRQAEALGNDPLITEALYQISLAAYFLEDFEEARAYLEIGLTHARLHGLESLEADLLNAQGVLEWKQGNLREATAKLEKALALKLALDQWASLSSIANNLGIIAYSLKDYSRAVSHYEKGLEWLEDRKNDRMRSSLLSNLAESLIPLGQYARAEAYLMESQDLVEAVNEPHDLAYNFLNLGELRSAQQRPEEAISLFRKAMNIQLSLGNEWAAALTRLKLSEEFLRQDNFGKAAEVLKPGYESVKRLNALTLLRDYAQQFARVYETGGEKGLARYYTDLREWFTTRIGSPASVPIASAQPAPPVDEPVRQAAPGMQNGFSPQRIAALGLLLLLVLILLLENIRLRRLMRSQ
jgi:tetratricopeptide (TPR) repeat protein